MRVPGTKKILTLLLAVAHAPATAVVVAASGIASCRCWLVGWLVEWLVGFLLFVAGSILVAGGWFVWLLGVALSSILSAVTFGHRAPNFSHTRRPTGSAPGAHGGRRVPGSLPEVEHRRPKTSVDHSID